MGWLFGKKKPQVPFPEGAPIEERALRFPSSSYGEKIIEPARVKEAAGIAEEMELPEEEELPKPVKGSAPLPLEPTFPSEFMNREPLFLHINVYRQILAEMSSIRAHLAELQETNKKLEKSEYNEEHNFERLRRAVKSMHDRLLQIDKVIFK